MNEDGHTSNIRDKILTINVKQGWRAGTKITFPKEGDQGPNNIPGKNQLVWYKIRIRRAPKRTFTYLFSTICFYPILPLLASKNPHFNLAIAWYTCHIWFLCLCQINLICDCDSLEKSGKWLCSFQGQGKVGAFYVKSGKFYLKASKKSGNFIFGLVTPLCHTTHPKSTVIRLLGMFQVHSGSMYMYIIIHLPGSLFHHPPYPRQFIFIYRVALLILL